MNGKMKHAYYSEMKSINSFSDPRIAFVKSLSKRKTAEENGCFFLEGERAVSEIPGEAGRVRMLLLSSTFSENIDKQSGRFELVYGAEKSGAEIIRVSDRIFASLTGTVTPQGIGAVVNRPDQPEPESLFREAGRLLVLENVQDPGNIGTCIRTADAFSFDGVICTGECADVYNPKVLRSTVGSLFHIPVIQYRHGIFRLVAAVRNAGIKVYGADPRGSVSSTDVSFGEGRVAVVIGNEANGLSAAAKETADGLVRIPMPGRAESLNAAIAASILMYQLNAEKGNVSHN